MRAQVTIGTDGIRDYIKFADGRTFTLGSVSVLKLVTESIRDGYECRRVLNDFLKNGHTVALLDLDAVERLVQRPRARWAFDKTLVSDLDRTPFLKGSSMDVEANSLNRQLDVIERHLQTLSKHAKVASQTKDSVKMATEVIESLKHYVHDLSLKSASQLNEELADSIRMTVEATLAGVEKAEKEGLPVDGTLVRADLHKIANRLASMVDTDDLANLDHGSLTYLAAEANEIRKYFV